MFKFSNQNIPRRGTKGTLFCRSVIGSLSLIILLAVASESVAQTEVAPFRPGVTLDGVNYFLPKTILRVVVVADKAETLPGEFAAYADRYLRLPSVPTAPSTEWTIKEVNIQALGAPDSTKAFNVKLRSKTSAPLVRLTDNGLLLSVNTDAEAEPEPAPARRVAAPKPVNGRDFMTHEILSAGSTAKMAQLTAEEIYDLRDSRGALIRGEADNTPKDGAQLKLMLDNLDAQAAALEALFKGQTLTSTEVQAIDFEPSGSTEQLGRRQLLCRFSRRLGLVDADDLSGQPIWITIKPLGNLPATADNADTAKKKAKIEQGLWVNQPARVQVIIEFEGEQLTSAEVPVCQLGTTEVLSDALFNKKLDTRVTLYQHTGSVKAVE